MIDPADLLEAARTGNGDAFERLAGPYRGELLAHCYRMLGSFHDAEDAVQESFVRAWRSLGTLDGRGHVRAWLYKIATNRCLTALEQRKRRELPTDVLPDVSGGEISWLEPFPNLSPEIHYLTRESVELAFVAALQHLSAGQRAALILRDVLGFTAAEVAEQLDTSTAAVNSALQRARQVVNSAGPSQVEGFGRLGSAGVDDVVTRWIDAWQAGDVDAIVDLLTVDARYSMPPLPEWYQGLEQIREFLLHGPLLERWRFLSTTANGQLAFGTYMWQDTAGAFVPGGLDVLTIRDGRVAAIVAFLAADFADFGLPATLPLAHPQN